MQEEQRKVLALEALAEPLRLKDVERMAAAIQEAEAAQVPEEALEEIRRCLAQEQRRVAAREALQGAVKRRKVVELQRALQEAEACYLEGSEVYEAKMKWG